MKNVLNFNPAEQEEVIKLAEESGEDIHTLLTSSFDSLMFLGKSIKSSDEESKDLAIFNIRLCYIYFHHKEDYIKLGKLHTLVQLLESDEESVVSHEIKDGVTINLN